MAQRATTAQNSKSGEEMAKNSDLLTQAKKSSSKFSSAYWSEKIFRPPYDYAGERREVAEWFTRVQYAGRREYVGLGNNNKEEAARRAAKLYSLIRAKGWTAALAEFKPDSAPRCTTTVGGYINAVESVS